MRQWPSPLLVSLEADTVNLQLFLCRWTSLIHRIKNGNGALFAGFCRSLLRSYVCQGGILFSNVSDVPLKRLEGGVPEPCSYRFSPSHQQRCPGSKRLLEHDMASPHLIRPGHCLGFMDTDHFRHRAVGLSLLGLDSQSFCHIRYFLHGGLHEIAPWRMH